MDKPLTYRRSDGGFFALDFGHPNMHERPTPVSTTAERHPLAAFGLKAVEIEDRSGTTAYHVPEGILTVYDPGHGGQDGRATADLHPGDRPGPADELRRRAPGVHGPADDRQVQADAGYFTASTSITNHSVALPGIDPAALRAVPEGRRDLEQDAAADLHPGEADAPALDQAAQRGVQGLAAGVALVERGLGVVRRAEVVDVDGVGGLHGRARPLLQDDALDRGVERGLVDPREVQARGFAVLLDHRRLVVGRRVLGRVVRRRGATACFSTRSATITRLSVGVDTQLVLLGGLAEHLGSRWSPRRPGSRRSRPSTAARNTAPS